jgi:hypothetical protein
MSGADVSTLKEPIGTGMAFGWLAAAILVTMAGALLAVRIGWWWIPGAAAVVVSQTAISTSWNDAKAGTVANVILAVAVLHGYLSHGPTSTRAEFRRLVRQTTADLVPLDGAECRVVTEDDLAHLPTPVAQYVKASGAVGRAHVEGFRAQIHGRIRGGPDEAWMQWVGEQVNTFGPPPSRVFFMDATMHGLPADVLHCYIGPTATVRVKAASAVAVVDAAGPEADQAETVTLLNDFCILVPAALVDVPIIWQAIDTHRTRATYTNAGHTVCADLTFDDDHQLIDFVSDDRYRASADGKAFPRQRWSTPVSGYRDIRGCHIAFGRGRWHPTDQPPFDYIEFFLDDITYLCRADATVASELSISESSRYSQTA